MPDPGRYGTREAFMKACVPMVIKEGTAEDGDQAVAICSSMWRRRDKKMIERKTLGGHVIEVKESESNGQPVGIVEGYLSAWGADTGVGARYGIPDRFHKGAWIGTIEEHKGRNTRPIRLKDEHYEIVGGVPIGTVKEDDRGLFGSAEVNLVSTKGKELYSLVKQRVITDFSVGFTAVRESIGTKFREIFEAKLWEVSLVSEPMHQGAVVTEVKAFQDFKLADRDTDYEPDDHTGLICFWENKMPFTAIQDGVVVAYPQAILRAAEEIKTGKITIPEDELPGVILHIERYCAKMDVPSPFGEEMRQFFGSEDVKRFDKRDLERALVKCGAFSKKAATILSSRFHVDQEDLASIYGDLMGMKGRM
jgi:HK97 family phage prohead protease